MEKDESMMLLVAEGGRRKSRWSWKKRRDPEMKAEPQVRLACCFY